MKTATISVVKLDDEKGYRVLIIDDNNKEQIKSNITESKPETREAMIAEINRTLASIEWCSQNGRKASRARLAPWLWKETEPAVLGAPRELRKVLCREARYMVIRGDLERATDQALSAIDDLAEVLTGDRTLFHGRSASVWVLRLSASSAAGGARAFFAFAS
jgi:hypothetical protein